MRMPDPTSESARDRLENANPKLHSIVGKREVTETELRDDVSDPIDCREIFDLIRNINDPEHPLTLEQLDVVKIEDVRVDDEGNRVHVAFTPTIPHCSMATIIGLSIRVKLLRSLPPRFKVDVTISPGTHASEAAVNKQLADKVGKQNWVLIGLYSLKIFSLVSGKSCGRPRERSPPRSCESVLDRGGGGGGITSLEKTSFISDKMDRYFIFLFWSNVIFLITVFLFQRGFLLSREVLPDRNECLQNNNSNNKDANVSCNPVPAHFDKAIVIIIDALKYDFAVYDKNLSSEDAKPYQNALPVIDKLVSSGQGRLYESMADPPTTTMQRLKGGLPWTRTSCLDQSSPAYQ